MKKILYTLFAFAIIVACEKDTVEMDVTNINSIEEVVDADFVSQEEIDAIVNDLLENLQNFGKSKRGQANLTGKGQDFVAIYIFSRGGIRYMAFVDESNDDLVFPSDLTVATLYFDNGNGDGSALVVENADEVEQLRLNGNFADFFSGANNELIQVTPRHRGTFDAANAVTVNGVSFSFAEAAPAGWTGSTANGITTMTNADLGTYTIQDAPFPLTGFLATFGTKTGAAATRTINNYAGTTSSSVMTEIENDFAGID